MARNPRQKNIFGSRLCHAIHCKQSETKISLQFINIFGSRLCHAIHCKQSETKISLQFILFINASPIPQNHKKNGRTLRKKDTHTHTPRKDMVVFLLKFKSRALNRTLISFSFPHRFWFLSWSSIRHSTDYLHVWSQNTFFMAKKNPQNETLVKMYFGREHVSGM